ncbi:hypothetical protein RZS28_11780 [Methylocapsa polymorpha]|uniref:Uncharacterized protein n=1 Tax=Methylocapsa polymorpha TaxID=3080828 RepID=A0ABZ0HNZ2_9HYPH|nr:hypothetical protein RZS28_11780 [Methylocapsa sp. RX1]
MKHVFGAAVILALATPAAGGGVTPCDVTGAIAAGARALEGPPVFDVARNCTAAFASKEAAGECIAREKIARSNIEPKWASLSDTVKRTCIARVPKATARAYFSLVDCALKEGRLDQFRSTEAAR